MLWKGLSVSFAPFFVPCRILRSHPFSPSQGGRISASMHACAVATAHPWIATAQCYLYSSEALALTIIRFHDSLFERWNPCWRKWLHHLDTVSADSWCYLSCVVPSCDVAPTHCLSVFALSPFVDDLKLPAVYPRSQQACCYINALRSKPITIFIVRHILLIPDAALLIFPLQR